MIVRVSYVTDNLCVSHFQTMKVSCIKSVDSMLLVLFDPSFVTQLLVKLSLALCSHSVLSTSL